MNRVNFLLYKGSRKLYILLQCIELTYYSNSKRHWAEECIFS